MKIILKSLITSFFCTSLLLASSAATAKQIEIGIAAVATDTRIVGKGDFVINDTLDEGDSLKTGEKGSTTILFNDESMLTLGSNAHVSVEIYEEAKDGKPGRSIIRVHKGQFRYFPGSILENGGSQFVAVGNKLLGKSATPNRRQRTNDQTNNSNTSNQVTVATERSQSDSADGKTNGRSQPLLTSSNEGSDSSEQQGGTTGVINGPPPERNQQQAAAGGGVMSNAQASDDSGSGSDSGSDSSGGGISGFVGGSASDAGTMAATETSPEDGGSSAAGGSTEPLVAAADPEASSDSSSDSSDSSSTTTADSSSASDSTSSSDTSSDTSSDVSTSDTRTGVNNAAREVNIVVAIGGSSGGAGTGGAGGGNQDCAEDCGNSGGGIVLPGGTPGGGLGTPGETGGIGGGFGTGSGIGGTGPGLPSNGGSNPDVFGGGLAGGTRTPIGGNIGGFIESGISGNVLAGKGNFRGNVDVFGSSGAQVSFLGTVSTDRNIGLDLGNQAALAGKGLSNNIGASADLLDGGSKLDSTLGNVASSGERFNPASIGGADLGSKFDSSAAKFDNPISGATFDTSSIKLDNPASGARFDTSSIKIDTFKGVDTSTLRVQTPVIGGGNKFNLGNQFRGGSGGFQALPKVQ